jgi:hypothetical protein
MAIFEGANESVEVYGDQERERIVVAPQGHWTMNTAKSAIDEFLRLLGDGSCHFVGDIRVVESYEAPVRKAWQKTFSAAGSKIRTYTFVGKSTPIVRMGVAAMSLYLGIPFKIVDMLDGLRPARRRSLVDGNERAS